MSEMPGMEWRVLAITSSTLNPGSCPPSPGLAPWEMCIRDRACNAPKAGEADFASVVEGLRKEAGRRAESVQRERQQKEEEKRRKRLEEMCIRDSPYSDMTP